MLFRLFLTLLLSIIIFQSCSSGSNKRHTPTAVRIKGSIVPKENFPKGEIIEKVVCKNDASQSYSMYLPSGYSTEKQFPIIFAFDSHGTGKLPVSNYKDLAEQYGYIIVGSNNSKNGLAWEESQTIANKLFADVQTRLSVNTQRIYLLGFSGGARVANGIAITNGSIAGVICCGAATPAINSSDPRNNYSFIGIAGNEDFNYTEMRKYDMVDLAGHSVKHTMITFNGKHEWPPKDVMQEAFWWLELNEMRKTKSYKNDSLISQNLQPILKQIKDELQKKQLFDAYYLCVKTIVFYDGLADLSYCLNTYKSLQTNDEIDRQLKLESLSWKKEEDLKQFYVQAFQTQDMAWWQKEIGDLNKKIKTEKDKNTVLMYKRTLGFLSLAAYMQASGALKQNAIPAAGIFCKIYLLVDPTNSEAYYLTASVFAIEGNTGDAIKSLNVAVKNGFIDIQRLQSDPVFSGIKNTKEFENLIGNILAKSNACKATSGN